MRWLLVLLTCVLVAGCAGGDGPAVPAPSPPPPPGTIVVEYTQGQIPPEVDTLKFFGLRKDEIVEYGPVVQPVGVEHRLEEVPIEVVILLIEYFDGDTLVAKSTEEVEVGSSGLTKVTNPDIEPVTARAPSSSAP